MKPLTALLLIAAVGTALAQTRPHSPASGTQAMYAAASETAERKFRHIQSNARKPRPDQRPTTFTEYEINAYLSSGRVKLPKGVLGIRLKGDPGVIRANARIDFDAITAGRRSANPLLVLFTGVHDVDVMAHAIGSGGQGRVEIDSAAIDGVAVPRIALEFFANRYIKPKHPNLGLTSVFALPDRIDLATIGLHTLTVTQK